MFPPNGAAQGDDPRDWAKIIPARNKACMFEMFLCVLRRFALRASRNNP